MVPELSSENVAQRSHDPAHLPLATVFLFLQLLKKGFGLLVVVFVFGLVFFLSSLPGAALYLSQEQLVLSLNLIRLVVFHTSAP